MNSNNNQKERERNQNVANLKFMHVCNSSAREKTHAHASICSRWRLSGHVDMLLYGSWAVELCLCFAGVIEGSRLLLPMDDALDFASTACISCPTYCLVKFRTVTRTPRTHSCRLQTPSQRIQRASHTHTLGARFTHWPNPPFLVQDFSILLTLRKI